MHLPKDFEKKFPEASNHLSSAMLLIGAALVAVEHGSKGEDANETLLLKFNALSQENGDLRAENEILRRKLSRPKNGKKQLAVSDYSDDDLESLGARLLKKAKEKAGGK